MAFWGGEIMLKKNVSVLFDRSVFCPEETVKLKPNSHYAATIQTFKKILGRAKDLGVKDLSKQHDHYLYGMEKR